MGKSRREFTPEFKDEAVKLVINTGRPVATVARELGINEASLGRWVLLFKARSDEGTAVVTKSERAELARLRKENADLKLDRAFLKKHPSSSPRKRRIRTGSVRADAGGEEQLQYRPDGSPAPGIPVGVLRMAGPPAVEKGDPAGISGGESGLVPRRFRRGLRLTPDPRRSPRCLVGVCPKKWRTTTIIDRADAYPADAVKRQWDTGALNQVWVGDITYLRTCRRMGLPRDRDRRAQSPGDRLGYR